MTAHVLRIAAFCVLVFCLAVAFAVAEPSGDTGGTDASSSKASPALERFKSLAGDWVAAEDGEMARKGDLIARYEVTAGGSAVVETVFPGTPHEMVTVYTADGSDLVLTHYCTEGNQPRMRARNPRGSRFDFVFDGGGKIDPKKDRHMNSATVELVSADEIRSVWTELEGGKPVFVAKSRLVRKTR